MSYQKTIKSLKDYRIYWLYHANNTHGWWWQNQINSGKSVETYIRIQYKKYCNRY